MARDLHPVHKCILMLVHINVFPWLNIHPYVTYDDEFWSLLPGLQQSAAKDLLTFIV